MVKYKVGDEVVVKIHEADYTTVAFEGIGTLSYIFEDHAYHIAESDYDIFTIYGDTIRPATKLDKVLK